MASAQPTATKPTGKKLITKNGNLFVNLLGMLFFMTPKGRYLIWQPTKNHGQLPNIGEWFRMQNEYKLPALNLTQKELKAAEIIREALSKDRFYGMTPCERALAKTHHNLFLRLGKRPEFKTKFVVEKKAPTPVRTLKTHQPAGLIMKKAAKKQRAKVFDGAINFKKDLGVDLSIPDEIRRRGDNLIAHGKFNNTNKLANAPGFDALRKLHFAAS
jgi:hypothetical protein